MLPPPALSKGRNFMAWHGIFAAVFATVSITAFGSSPIPSDVAEAYYRTHFDNCDEGVYEWPEKGLLFLKAVMPSGRGVGEEELTRTQKLMRNWLASQAAVQRVDPDYHYGLDLMRRICREYQPDLEYMATWNFSGESCALTYERGRMHELVTVLWRDDLLKALPKAFLEPVSQEVWRRGIKSIVSQRYARQCDFPFMWRIGALDCYMASMESSLQFPEFIEVDFPESLRRLYDAASQIWVGVDSPAAEEYGKIEDAILKYVLEDERCVTLLADARAVVAPAPRVSFSAKMPNVHSTTNVTIVCTTNSLANAEPKIRTDRFVQSAGRMALPVPVAGNEVNTVIEEVDDSVITEVETITIVRTTDRIMRKVSTTCSGEPLFEKLFLSGGCLANKPRQQTALGKEAAKAFSAKISAAERERRIVDALRENPGDKELWNLFGRILQGKGEHYGAIICFRNALRLDRMYDFALTNLAISYDELGMKRLACSTALIAQNLTANKWCLDKVEGIINKER